ncbi:cytokine receptor-like factor 2 isoform X2 [Castor canadensis]|nr:cytokine receptor-like factor 2 isoform X1 [Castor canadensis]
MSPSLRVAMSHLLLPWATSVTILLLAADAVASGDLGDGDDEESLQLDIICFNFENVRVMWNLTDPMGTNLTVLYRFDMETVDTPCTHYLLHQGFTSGCVLPAQRGVLHLTIRNETHILDTRSRLASDFLKPGTPRDVTFLWQEDKLTVTCTDLVYNGLLYEVQFRSVFDTKWQSKEAKTCNVAIEGLDGDKCYYFRVRVKTREAYYGPDTFPSDWSEVTHWHSARLRDSCPDWQSPPQMKFPQFILISTLLSLLIVSLLLLSLWKLQRVKNLLMPYVPDPKCSFPGLFEDHKGDFQRWILDTQNVVPMTKMDIGDKECHLEDALVVQLSKAEAEPSSMTTQSSPQTGDGEATEGSPQLNVPQGGNMVSLGGFTFTMRDNSYMML